MTPAESIFLPQEPKRFCKNILMQISPSQIQPFFSPFFREKSGVSEESSESSALRSEEQAEIAKLQKRDREVRSHEQAHLAAAGGIARGGANFSFQRGPDGKQYAIGGEVNIDTSPVSGNPQATIRKAQQIRAAALAPANPSGQDRAVAATASALEAEAPREILKEEQETRRSDSDPSTALSSPRIDLFV